MSNLVLVTYATESHKQIRRDLVFSAVQSHQFDNIFNYTPVDIDEHFYFKNEHILTKKFKGKTTGCFLWKPYLILKALNKVREGDVILYMDCCDGFISTSNLKGAIDEAMVGNDMILTKGGYVNKDWTKMDCFVYMGCNEPKYHNMIQLEAGIGLYKKNENTIRFVKEWLYFCQDIRIVGDGENMCGLPNFDGFKEARHDQSVLSCLSKKYGIEGSDFLRRFITCNMVEV